MGPGLSRHPSEQIQSYPSNSSRLSLDLIVKRSARNKIVEKPNLEVPPEREGEIKRFIQHGVCLGMESTVASLLLGLYGSYVP